MSDSTAAINTQLKSATRKTAAQVPATGITATGIILPHRKTLAGDGFGNCVITVPSSATGAVITTADADFWRGQATGIVGDRRLPQMMTCRNFGICGPHRTSLSDFAESSDKTLVNILDGIDYVGCGGKFDRLKVIDVQGVALRITGVPAPMVGGYDYSDEECTHVSNVTLTRNLSGLVVENGADTVIDGCIIACGSRDYNIHLKANTGAVRLDGVHAYGAGIANLRIEGNGHIIGYIQVDASVKDGLQAACHNSTFSHVEVKQPTRYGIDVTGTGNIFATMNCVAHPSRDTNCVVRVAGPWNRIISGNIDAGSKGATGLAVLADQTHVKDVLISSQSDCPGLVLGDESTFLSHCDIDVTVANWGANIKAAAVKFGVLGSDNRIRVRWHGYAAPNIGTIPGGNDVQLVEF